MKDAKRAQRAQLVVALGTESKAGGKRRKLLNQAAARANKPVSAWAREVLLAYAGAAVKASPEARMQAFERVLPPELVDRFQRLERVVAKLSDEVFTTAMPSSAGESPVQSE